MKVLGLNAVQTLSLSRQKTVARVVRSFIRLYIWAASEMALKFRLSTDLAVLFSLLFTVFPSYWIAAGFRVPLTICFLMDMEQCLLWSQSPEGQKCKFGFWEYIFFLCFLCSFLLFHYFLSILPYFKFFFFFNLLCSWSLGCGWYWMLSKSPSACEVQVGPQGPWLIPKRCLSNSQIKLFPSPAWRADSWVTSSHLRRLSCLPPCS